MGSWKEKWWNWGTRGALVVRCASPGTDISFVLCFKDDDYEKALGPPVVAKRDFSMSKTSSEIVVLQGFIFHSSYSRINYKASSMTCKG